MTPAAMTPARDLGPRELGVTARPSLGSGVWLRSGGPRPLPATGDNVSGGTIGDKGYDADSSISSLEGRAIKVVIPPKLSRNRPELR